MKNKILILLISGITLMVSAQQKKRIGEQPISIEPAGIIIAFGCDNGVATVATLEDTTLTLHTFESVPCTGTWVVTLFATPPRGNGHVTGKIILSKGKHQEVINTIEGITQKDYDNVKITKLNIEKNNKHPFIKKLKQKPEVYIDSEETLAFRKFIYSISQNNGASSIFEKRKCIREGGTYYETDNKAFCVPARNLDTKGWRKDRKECINDGGTWATNSEGGFCYRLLDSGIFFNNSKDSKTWILAENKQYKKGDNKPDWIELLSIKTDLLDDDCDAVMNMSMFKEISRGTPDLNLHCCNGKKKSNCYTISRGDKNYCYTGDIEELKKCVKKISPQKRTGCKNIPKNCICLGNGFIMCNVTTQIKNNQRE